MFHPLLSDYSTLKDAELENKILDLGKKFRIAQQLGQGSVATQIMLVLTALKDEQSKRIQTMLKKSQGQDKNLDDLININ